MSTVITGISTTAPKVTSKVTIKDISRAEKSVTLQFDFDTWLGSASSHVDKTYIYCDITVSGSGISAQKKRVTVKDKYDIWKGTTHHYVTHKVVFNVAPTTTNLKISLDWSYSEFPGENWYANGSLGIGRYYYKPTLSSISGSIGGSTSLSASYTIQNDGGGAISGKAVKISTDNFKTTKESKDGTSATFTGLSPKTTYYLKGAVVNPAGMAETNVISLVTYPSTVSIKSVSVSGATPYAFNASWAPSASADVETYQYKVYKYVGSSWQVERTVSTTSTSVSISGLTPNTTYKVGVQAKTKRSGVWSSEVSSSSITTPLDQATIWTRSGGSWKKGKCWVKSGGEWRRAKAIYVKVGGKWQLSKQ